jgi:hypothetical protein
LAYTAQLRAELPALFDELGVRTLLDAPCGDPNWIRAVEWRSPIRYIGGDISPALVADNTSCFSATDRTFVVLDIRRDPLPAADLWLCRNWLFHLPERDIFATLANYVRHNIPYLLTPSHPGCRLNTDAPTGEFRLLNLELPPYNLGRPQCVVSDWVPEFAKRNLALWSREQVATALKWPGHGVPGIVHRPPSFCPGLL